jgi:WD40 repeat protein
VTSLAFSPDGRLLVAGTTENLVKLWFLEDPINPGAGLTELGLLPHGDWVTSVAVSTDGRWLASASAGSLGASATPGSEAAATPGSEPSTTPSFAPVIYLWRVSELLLEKIDEAEPRVTLRLPAGPVHQLAFSPDSRFLAAAGEEISIWQINRQKRVATLEGIADSLAFSPDGALLASGGQDRLFLWDFQAVLKGERQPVTELAAPGGEILQLAFHPTGRSLAVLSADGSLWLWGVLP